jgi:hypothetical protein
MVGGWRWSGLVPSMGEDADEEEGESKQEDASVRCCMASVGRLLTITDLACRMMTHASLAVKCGSSS